MSKNRASGIRINDLNVSFEGKRTILKDFNLELQPGEKILLEGPSGCGKSTVLHCILGFVAPDSGEITIDGTRLGKGTVWAARQHLAYVGQEPDLGRGTVYDYLKAPFAYAANKHLTFSKDEALGLFDEFHLSRDLMKQDTTKLSGGEKQRVALVSAVLLKRSLLLLDEASSALDQQAKRSVVEFFKHRKDLTALAVSHDTEWQPFADRVIKMGVPQ